MSYARRLTRDTRLNLVNPHGAELFENRVLNCPCSNHLVKTASLCCGTNRHQNNVNDAPGLFPHLDKREFRL